MTGASHWLHVGRLQIGAYTDASGKRRLALRGDCSIDQLADVLTSLRAVAISAEHATPDPTDTGLLHHAMVTP